MRLPRPAILAFFLSGLISGPSASRAADIAKGADVSWLQQMADPSQGSGPFQFYDTDGLQRDPDQVTNCLKILKERGIDTVRLRVFVPPVTQPYWDNQLAGHCTIEEMAPVAAKAAALGFRVMIDLHYSWTFADPGNQRLPVDWANEISGLSTADAIAKVASEVTAHTVGRARQVEGRRRYPGMGSGGQRNYQRHVVRDPERYQRQRGGHGFRDPGQIGRAWSSSSTPATMP